MSLSVPAADRAEPGERLRSPARLRWLVAALLVAAAVTYAIPLGERSLWNQDEARVALLARDTLRHGLHLPVTVRGDAYLNKPPLFFWTVALVSWPAGDVSEHTAPIPSVAAALAALAGVFALGRLLSGPRTGLVALIVLGTSPGFFVHSHQVVPDMALTAWLTWSLYFLLAALREDVPSRAQLIGLYGCIAGALWVKGVPALLVLPAATAAVLSERGRRGLAPLRPVLGLTVVAVTMLPWAIPYFLAPGSGQSTSATTALMWYLDRVDRVSSIPLTGGLVAFLPWAAWLLVVALWWRGAPERVAYRPVLVWTLVAAGLIALAVQQRSRYLLPLYPAMALLIAAAVTGVTARARELLRLATGLVLALIALTLYQGLMQGVKLALGRHHGRPVTPLAALLDLSREGPLIMLLILVALALALRALWAHRSPTGAVVWIAAGLGAVLFIEAWLYPGRLTEQVPIGAFAATVRPRLEQEVPILSYPDGNLAFDFYLDHPVREVNDIDVVRSNLQQPVSGYLLLRQPVWQQHKPQAHDSWCPIVEAGIGQRAFVLLGPCS
jgi:4-amino-4-deoxy-L-arabinose transferase-like glycosyltransferase